MTDESTERPQNDLSWTVVSSTEYVERLTTQYWVWCKTSTYREVSSAYSTRRQQMQILPSRQLCWRWVWFNVTHHGDGVNTHTCASRRRPAFISTFPAGWRGVGHGKHTPTVPLTTAISFADMTDAEEKLISALWLIYDVCSLTSCDFAYSWNSIRLSWQTFNMLLKLASSVLIQYVSMWTMH